MENLRNGRSNSDYFINNTMSISRVLSSFRTRTKTLTPRRIIVRKLRHCWTEVFPRSSIFATENIGGENLDFPPTSKIRICNSAWRHASTVKSRRTFNSIIMKNCTIRRIMKWFFKNYLYQNYKNSSVSWSNAFSSREILISISWFDL